MKNIGKIYIITNLINKKIYIGQTIQSLNTRFNEHKCNALTKNKKSKLYTAIRKYGIDNFKIQLLEDNIPINLLNDKEEHYIKFFNTVDKGYNIKYREKRVRNVEDYNEKDIIKMYKNKTPIKVIAKKYKACKKTISAILKENGIEIRDWNKEQSVGVTKETLYDLYVNKKMKLTEVGELIGLSSTAVSNWLRKFNIDRRLPHNYKELKCHS